MSQMILPSNKGWSRYRTENGICINEKCEIVLEKYVRQNYEGKVQLVFTSPPFPLNRAKRYGNLGG